ncbi:MAG: hypothetical protein IT160_09300 [Bryobacterales bacterium]|nr:hypothetical protein [Bryobacterales bacterium]
MKRLHAAAFLFLLTPAFAQTEVAVVLSPRATEVEKLAASELTAHLALLYPATRFVVSGSAVSGPSVLLGTPASMPELAGYLQRDHPGTPDSFVVTTVKSRNTRRAVVAGADPRGALFAVYALLEKLGFGFYLSYSTQPPARQGPFNFDGWALADRPLAATRMVFNWHNFLSGCSTWDLQDWQNWIAQAARMRFNTVMVHAYGNNPMFSFTHNGVRKPTGYLSTTARGRDWGTEHVLDARSVIGAAGLLNEPVFGSTAGLVPEDQTVEAAAELMRKAFRFAAARGMGVTFALDVDTSSANPQNIIAQLPVSARFSVNGFQLADPEAPEGRAYYRSQLEQLLKTYPEITRIAIWFRNSMNSPWRGIKRRDFPPSWRTRYEQALEARPALRGDPDSPSMFAIARIVSVFRSILDESGHHSVELAAGSWRFDYMRAADAFMPPGVALIPLDYDYAFSSDPAVQAIHAISDHRRVIPVVWAQHDDHSYIGRPYLPFTGFASMLRRTGSAGFGIIHWTTRPLDLYFKSLGNQVWLSRENELLSATCDRMALDTFGAAARQQGSRYLPEWIQDAPMFGRETSDRFIDQRLDEAPVADGCRRRLRILEGVKSLAHSPEAAAWASYFEGLERFTMEFYHAQSAWHRSVAAVESGDAARARNELAGLSAQAVIKRYAQTIAHGGATRGEKGVLISLNLRWLPYYVALRQALGQEPLRVRFAPTVSEALAQAPGRNSFAFDADHHLWRVLGKDELGADVRSSNGGRACSGGLKVDRDIPVSLRLLGSIGLPDGRKEMKVELEAGSSIEVLADGTHRLDASHDTVAVQAAGGRVNFTLRPVHGTGFVCGIVLNPVSGQATGLR